MVRDLDEFVVIGFLGFRWFVNYGSLSEIALDLIEGRGVFLDF